MTATSVIVLAGCLICLILLWGPMLRSWAGPPEGGTLPEPPSTEGVPAWLSPAEYWEEVPPTDLADPTVQTAPSDLTDPPVG